MFNKSCELMCTMRNTVFSMDTVWMHFSNSNGSKSEVIENVKWCKNISAKIRCIWMPFVLFLRNESIDSFVWLCWLNSKHWNVLDIRLLIGDSQGSSLNTLTLILFLVFALYFNSNFQSSLKSEPRPIKWLKSMTVTCWHCCIWHQYRYHIVFIFFFP